MRTVVTTIGKNLFLLAVLASVLGAGLARAGTPHSVNVNEQGVAIHGYDPVAYFRVGEPVEGRPELSASHEGATYHFSSSENLTAFQADPDSYTPRYGGFCAMGTALGKKLDIDPAAFTVVDGELYLNLNLDVRDSWREDVEANIDRADAKWPDLRDQPAE